MSDLPETSELTRAEVDQRKGPVVIEFGAAWCSICRAFAPQFEKIHADFPDVQHNKIEDGPGLPLGRSFRVTLWPTFVFLNDGVVQAKLVRPGAGEVRGAFELMSQATSHDSELRHRR
jgi:thioredoxin 1